MFTLNISFQIMTPLYRIPALEKFEEADGSQSLYHDHVYDNCTWKSNQILLA